jgi:hypothetical protein
VLGWGGGVEVVEELVVAEHVCVRVRVRVCVCVCVRNIVWCVMGSGCGSG